MVLIVGIDEAGRGPVIGPMVICGFGVEEDKLKELEKIDKVRDSKELSKEERENLYEILVKMADFLDIKIIDAEEINKLMSMGLNLNKIELIKIREILEKIDEEFILYLDSPSVNKKKIEDTLKNFGIKNLKKIIVDFDADKKYKVVSAASIIAKVTRDRIIKEIEKEVGREIGSGYPHDKKTIEFIEWVFKEKKKEFEKYIRMKWETVKNIRSKLLQKSLLDFFENG